MAPIPEAEGLSAMRAAGVSLADLEAEWRARVDADGGRLEVLPPDPVMVPVETRPVDVLTACEDLVRLVTKATAVVMAVVALARAWRDAAGIRGWRAARSARPG